MGGGHILTQEAPLETSKTRNLLEDPRLGQHVASLPEKNKKIASRPEFPRFLSTWRGLQIGGGSVGREGLPPFFRLPVRRPLARPAQLQLHHYQAFLQVLLLPANWRGSVGGETACFGLESAGWLRCERTGN